MPQSLITKIGAILFILSLAACQQQNAIYEITVINATNNQPLSPVAVVLHNRDFSAWSIGEPASLGLEQLAESGSPVDFLNEAETTLDIEDMIAADGVLPPGQQVTLEVSAQSFFRLSNLEITIATMLVNTNDAFTGITGESIGKLRIGQSLEILAPIYDAGTEENSETTNSIPGPAAGGEGFNLTRESRNIVTRHPGVVTQADDFAESVLDESHRFDNGAMLIKISRVQ